MKTKIITVFLLLFFISKNSLANNYHEGDMLYVWAVNGLKLRKGPSLDFPIIKKLKYGEKVKVTDALNDMYRMSIKVIDRKGTENDFEIKGNWIKINLINSDKTEGYIYDGYLSRLPVLKLNRDRKYDKQREEYWKAESFGFYAKREFGGVQLIKDEKDFPRKGEVVYGNNVKVIFLEWECSSFEIEIPQINFNEAYLLSNLMYQIEKKEQFLNSINWEDEVEIGISKEGNEYKVFNITFEDGLTYGIRFRNGKIVISEGRCC